MTAPAVSRGTTPTPHERPPRPVATLDDILLELIDIGDNVRDDVGDLSELKASIAELDLIEPIKVTAQPGGRYLLVAALPPEVPAFIDRFYKGEAIDPFEFRLELEDWLIDFFRMAE